MESNGITNKNGVTIKLARLKISGPDTPRTGASGLTDTQQRLVDLIDLSPEALAKTNALKRVDSKLQSFAGFWRQFFGGSGHNASSTSYKPQSSKIDVEYITKTFSKDS